MPYGRFTFEGEYDKIAFLSGGIGITPIRSICKCACDKKLPADMILIYGNRTERDIVFHEDFLAMEAENRNLRVVYTVDTPMMDKNRWKGKSGFITSEMIKEAIPDYRERIFYVCGPPKMVDYLRALLSEELKIPKEKMKVEQFSGYI
jgi:ferredoxin-NADP reductase